MLLVDGPDTRWCSPRPARCSSPGSIAVPSRVTGTCSCALSKRSSSHRARSTSSFHGEAGETRAVRRHLIADRGFAREAVSVPPYWRRSYTDERTSTPTATPGSGLCRRPAVAIARRGPQRSRLHGRERRLERHLTPGRPRHPRRHRTHPVGLTSPTAAVAWRPCRATPIVRPARPERRRWHKVPIHPRTSERTLMHALRPVATLSGSCSIDCSEGALCR